MTKPGFATEVDLCARFLEALASGDDRRFVRRAPDTATWTPYAETAGWDILLVRKADGFQIGIQAKLKLGVDVINQMLEEYSSWSADHAGPDCRAVLVPDRKDSGFGRIADYIGFTIIRVHPSAVPYFHTAVFQPYLPRLDQRHTEHEWHEWAPAKRHQLPEYVPDVAAGASAPLQLTDWKIAALKIAVTLDLRGYVTRADFKAHRIDHRRWLAAESRWLERGDGGYVRGPGFPNFRIQHPIVYEQIKADAPKWMAALERKLI